MIGIEEQANGKGAIVEPFPPGTFEEYSLGEDGRATLIRRQSYHTPGDRPKFLPFVLYEGKCYVIAKYLVFKPIWTERI